MDTNIDTRPLPEGWEERFDETYWLWIYSNPPQKSYRHPLGDITGSGRRASATTINGSRSSPSPLPSDPTVNNDAHFPEPLLDRPETAQDAPAYSEVSELLEDAEQHEYTINQDYREGVSSPSSFSTLTDSSVVSELSAPPPSADDFQAASARQQAFIASTAAPVPLQPQPTPPPVSGRYSLTARPSNNGQPPPLLRSASAVAGPRVPLGPNKPRASSLITKVIPTLAFKYRSNVFGSPRSDSSNSNPSSASSVPGLYTQVQYLGPQVQNQTMNGNMQPLQSQPQPGPPPPMMWRQDPQGQFQNQTIVPSGQVQPQFQPQVPTQTQYQNVAAHTPSQPPTLGAMPKPGQPGYAGFAPPPPSGNQTPVLVQSPVQVQGQAPVQQYPPQQSMAPPSNQVPQGVPPRSSPPPGGIIPAPYKSSPSPPGPQSSPQQRPGSGMPPYSSPPPGGFAPAAYNGTPPQVPGRPPSQQGPQQTFIPPQSNPPPGGFAPVAYTPPQVQTVPSGHPSVQQQPQQVSQQVGMPPQSSPPPGQYVPVSYNAPQAQQQLQQPQVQQATVQQTFQQQQQGQTHFRLPQLPTSTPNQSLADQQSMDMGVSSQTNSVPVSYYPAQTSSPTNAQSSSTPSSPSPRVDSPSSSSNGATPMVSPQSQSVQASTQTQIQTQVEQPVSGPTSNGVNATLSISVSTPTPATTQAQSNPLQPVTATAQGQQPFQPMPYVGSVGQSSTPSLPPRRLQKPNPHQNYPQQQQQQYPQYQHPPPSNVSYTSPPSQVPTLPTMSGSPLPPGNTQAPPQQPSTSSTYNPYTPVAYGQTGATQNIPIQASQQNMQYNTQPQPQPPQQATNQQPQQQQYAANQQFPQQQYATNQQPQQQQYTIPYGSYIPVNYGPTAAGQNIPTQTPQQYYPLQNPQATASQPQAPQQATNQQQTAQGNSSKTQKKSKFTFSNITDAINLGVSAINLFESVDNAVNPGSYPGVSSNSGGGTNVTLNINGGGGDQGGGQNSSGGSRLNDANNLVNSLTGAVSAVSSLNIGGNSNLGAATNLGFNNPNAFTNSGLNNAGGFGY